MAPTLPLFILYFVNKIPTDRRAKLLLFYAAIAFIWAPYTMSAVGVAQNGIFDYVIAIALITGLSFSQLSNAIRPFALAMLVLPIGVVASKFSKPHRVWQSFQTLEAEYGKDKSLIRSFEGPALCHATAVCFWAGKPFHYDPFNTVRKMKIDPLYRSIIATKFERILCDLTNL